MKVDNLRVDKICITSEVDALGLAQSAAMKLAIEHWVDVELSFGNKVYLIDVAAMMQTIKTIK